MHSTVQTARRILTVLIVLAIWMTCLPTVYAEPECLPGVTTEMADPGYWTARSKDPDALLAESSGIADDDAGSDPVVPPPRSRGVATAFVAALLLVPVLWWAFARLLG